MGLYKIADCIVDMEPKGELLKRQSQKYQIINAGLNEEYIHIDQVDCERYREQYPLLTSEEIEYMLTGGQFYRKLLEYNGMMLHASGVVFQEKAYLFSADPGTGKSTHTGLWKEYFGDSVYIINDDKPAIRLLEDRLIVYGTPWSGKTDQNENRRAELGGICFLAQAKINEIKCLEEKEAVKKIFSQTIRHLDENQMGMLLNLIAMLLKKQTVYELHCNISFEAVQLSCFTMVK